MRTNYTGYFKRDPSYINLCHLKIQGHNYYFLTINIHISIYLFTIVNNFVSTWKFNVIRSGIQLKKILTDT